jgi:hypothetical protein
MACRWRRSLTWTPRWSMREEESGDFFAFLLPDLVAAAE